MDTVTGSGQNWKVILTVAVAGGETMFDRITSDPAVLGGKPVIRGTRISVEFVLEWLASGADRDEIVRQYPQLTAEDVSQAIAFAAASFRNDVLLTAEVSS